MRCPENLWYLYWSYTKLNWAGPNQPKSEQMLHKTYRYPF